MITNKSFIFRVHYIDSINVHNAYTISLLRLSYPDLGIFTQIETYVLVLIIIHVGIRLIFIFAFN
jgi:hypothetical protein